MKEIISYTENNQRLLPLGVEGDICIAVRELYYSGYSDLNIEEGVITILKDIESVMGPSYIDKVRKIDTTDIPNQALNLEAYFKTLNISFALLDDYERGQKKRVNSISKLSQLQLLDPIFKRKFAEGRFKYYPKKTVKISKVALIEDGSSSMIYVDTVEKLLGTNKGIENYFSDAEITKYRGIEDSLYKTKLNYINSKGLNAPFKLGLYLDKIDNVDLVVVCTNARYSEFELDKIDIPMIIFNIGEDKYPPIPNTTTFQI